MNRMHRGDVCLKVGRALEPRIIALLKAALAFEATPDQLMVRASLGHHGDHINFDKHSWPCELANVDECVSRQRRLAICLPPVLPRQLLMTRVDDIGHLFDNVGHSGAIACKYFFELSVGVSALRGKV